MSGCEYLVGIDEHRNSSEDEGFAKRPGPNLGWYAEYVVMTAANLMKTKAESMGLMKPVCERGNLMKAFERVIRNKGAAGVDAVGVPEFKAHLQRHWPSIKGHLIAGTYVPNAVRRVTPQGGTRMLGIPTLTDRLIQQALHQILSPIFELTLMVSISEAERRD